MIYSFFRIFLPLILLIIKSNKITCSFSYPVNLKKRDAKKNNLRKIYQKRKYKQSSKVEQRNEKSLKENWQSKRIQKF